MRQFDDGTASKLGFTSAAVLRRRFCYRMINPSGFGVQPTLNPAQNGADDSFFPLRFRAGGAV